MTAASVVAAVTFGSLTSTVAAPLHAAVAAAPQAAEGLKPLGVEPPIGGPVWTVAVPALLLVAACAATWMLYRRFSGE